MDDYFSTLWERGKPVSPDITIYLSDLHSKSFIRFMAHRVVLMFYSEYFGKCLAKDENIGLIYVPHSFDISAPYFQTILNYLYTQDLNDKDLDWFRIYRHAKDLEITTLVKFVEIGRLDVIDVKELYKNIFHYTDPLDLGWRNHYCTVFGIQFSKFSNYHRFIDLPQDALFEILKGKRPHGDEMQVFLSILKWLKINQKNQDDDVITHLLSYVSFVSLDITEMVNCVEASQNVFDVGKLRDVLLYSNWYKLCHEHQTDIETLPVHIFVPEEYRIPNYPYGRDEGSGTCPEWSTPPKIDNLESKSTFLRSAKALEDSLPLRNQEAATLKNRSVNIYHGRELDGSYRKHPGASFKVVDYDFKGNREKGFQPEASSSLYIEDYSHEAVENLWGLEGKDPIRNKIVVNNGGNAKKVNCSKDDPFWDDLMKGKSKNVGAKLKSRYLTSSGAESANVDPVSENAFWERKATVYKIGHGLRGEEFNHCEDSGLKGADGVKSTPSFITLKTQPVPSSCGLGEDVKGGYGSTKERFYQDLDEKPVKLISNSYG